MQKRTKDQDDGYKCNYSILQMKVEVWTDIMCPYCYIGKIHYEKAMQQFAHADEVELVIKSFQLNPDLPGNGGGYPVVDYLVKRAGFPESSIKQMFAGIEQLALNAGVKFNLTNAVAANTLDAHRLVKFAAKKELASDLLMLISKAYFEDALDYSDRSLLKQIGMEAGLDPDGIDQLFAGDDLVAEVKEDIREAQLLGIDTVPTFLFDRKQAIIGSEPVEVFLDTLNQAYADWKKADPSPDSLRVRRGKSCNADGVCEI
jgi:predicted DsbA family dithiol-disulfide isomerase